MLAIAIGRDIGCLGKRCLRLFLGFFGIKCLLTLLFLGLFLLFEYLLCLLLLGKLLLILSYLFFECLLCARLLFK